MKIIIKKIQKKRFIIVKGIKNVENGYFQTEHFLSCPGKSIKKLSLRIGLNIFSEGILLSYEETFDKSEDYRPFYSLCVFVLS